MNNKKTFTQMTADEQMQWAAAFGEYLKTQWPLLEPVAVNHGQQLTADHQSLINALFDLLDAWPFATDFISQARKYGDYAARVYRLPVYIEKVKDLLSRTDTTATRALVTLVSKPAGGRRASAATIARREAEARAASQQQQLFTKPATTPSTTPAVSPAGSNAVSPSTTPAVSPAGSNAVSPVGSPAASFIPTTFRDDAEYRLSVAQKRAFLSPDLQQRADQIRTLRTASDQAAERARTMGEMKAPAKDIKPVAEEAIRAHDEYVRIYADIDEELAVLYYRLLNDSPEWRLAFLRKYGYIKGSVKPADLLPLTDYLHADLLHDLKKHYEKLQSPEFDVRCRILVEQESPEYVERQKQETEKQAEVQAIVRYLRRTDKPQSDTRLKTARSRFKRLQQLLGKKEAEDYRPLLTFIEEENKKLQAGKKKSAAETMNP